MKQDTLNSQGGGNGASMLTPGSTKAYQCVISQSMTLCLSQCPNGSTHGFIGHLKETVGDEGREDVRPLQIHTAPSSAGIGS